MTKNIPADENLKTDLRDLAFIPSLESANSFKEFFLMIDAMIPLEWKVEITFLKQLFCCGAEKTCPLPKWSGEFSGSATEESFEKTKRAIEFIQEHFHQVVTRDDMFLLKNQFPLIYEWYKKNSSSMLIGSLDNNGLVRQTPLITADFDFKGVQGVKLGSYFLSNLKAAKAAQRALYDLADRMPIYDLQMAIPDNQEIASVVMEIKAWGEAMGIPTFVVTQEELDAERRVEDGVAPVGEYEYYEEHALFFVQDRFYLNKYDHLGCQDGSFYIVGDDDIDNCKFLANMLKRKIDMYTENVEVSVGQGVVHEYFKWASTNIKVNDDYNFIPAFMLNKTSKYYSTLLNARRADHRFELTPPGLWSGGKPKPIVEIIHES